MSEINVNADKRLIQDLIIKFTANQSEYESNGYLESQLRTDFIDEMFKAMGWDVSNKKNHSRIQREVLVEKGDTKGRPDYSFRVNGEDRFFVETKSPSRGTDKPEDIFQAKRYAWNTTNVSIVILTDFKTLKVFDASLKPDIAKPKVGLVFELKFQNFLSTDFANLTQLCRVSVIDGSLERLTLKDANSKRDRIPVDLDLVEKMTYWREQLAKDIFKHNADITVRQLNDVVQRLLDRFIFIRLLEDRKIIDSKSLKEIVETWKQGKHRAIQVQLNVLFKSLNNDFNGEVFKEHLCEKIEYDSEVIADIIEQLYYPRSPYDFAVIGVELLGTIYEKYLGKTIRLTEKRVKVEEKPEVRKAGGVFYTPSWVVSKIVENTLGEVVKNKSADELGKIHVVDPACGSGSFLISALDYLLKHYLIHYINYPRDARRNELLSNVVTSRDEDGQEIPRLSLYRKGEILKNNIFGVDLDPQAVEITTMSLYIKILEGERALPHNKELLPSLSNNIRSGNSLIGLDFYEQKTLVDDAEREKVNAFEWKSKATGFGKIFEAKGGFDVVIGNPPYVRSVLLREEPETWQYLKNHYPNVVSKEFDIYLCFLEKGYSILAPNGHLGYIMPNKWLHAEMGDEARAFFKENRAIKNIINFHSYQVFKEVTTYTALIFSTKTKNEAINVLNYIGPIDKECVPSNFNDRSLWQNGSFRYECLSKSPWNLVTGEGQNILETLKSLPKLGEYFSLAKGTGTCADPIFFVRKIAETQSHFTVYSKEQEKEIEIEKLFVKPSAKGKDIDSYHIKNDAQLLIFPYEGKKLISGLEIKKRSPKLWSYLESCREALERREKGRWKGDSFYCYGRPQNHDILPLPKIIVPVVVNRAKCAWDSKGLHVIDSVYFVVRKKPSDLSEEYILALLNSNLLTYFLMKTSSNLRGGYFSMKPGYVDPFPLKVPLSEKEKETYEKIVSIVKRINLLSENCTELARREVIALKENIDGLIYSLYEIMDEEKRTIEATVG